MNDVPWYAYNHQLHNDLNFQIVRKITGQLTKSYEARLCHHPNTEAIQPIGSLVNDPSRGNSRWILSLGEA